MDFLMTTHSDMMYVIISYMFPNNKSEFELYNILLEYCYKNNNKYWMKAYVDFNRFLLLKKYKKYDNNYATESNRETDNYLGGSELLDALFTGCNLPFGRGTFSTYTSSIEEDIKFIISYLPESIKCTN